MEQAIERPEEAIAGYVCAAVTEAGSVEISVSSNHRTQFSVQNYVTTLQRKHPGKTTVKFVSLDELSELRAVNGLDTGKDSQHDNVESQTRVLRYFRQAVELGASDIHFTIGRDNSDFTYIEVRVHGELKQLDCIDRKEGMRLAAAICQGMCDITEKQFYPNRQQDGRIREEFVKPLGIFGARYSHTPAVGGLYAVMRIIPDEGSHVPTLAELGFLPEQETIIRRILRRPEGIVVLSGPTGSGKSTTLRVFSHHYLTMSSQGKNRMPGKRLLTVEDPPEGRIAGAIQTPIIADKKDAHAVTLAWLRAIASALRLDPDAILNGEIRDRDSAMAAINAAMTGHLLMTTLHANDAVSILERLEIMGIPGRLIADAWLMVGLISQRLVQRLCPQCKVPWSKEMDRLEESDRALIEKYCQPENVWLRHRQGCCQCWQGVVARTVIAEVIAPDAQFFEIYLTRGKAAAKTYWKNNLAGITRNQHLLRYVNAGEVDPLAAHALCPLDEDSYTLIT
jgi:type II secretory ATPase GspE/PulE/Tfp pilus assembly ATPase PilB-like protein